MFMEYNRACNCLGLSLSLASLLAAVFCLFRPATTEMVRKLAYFQSLFAFEVFNALFCKTNQKLLPSAMQLGSRVFIIWKVSLPMKTRHQPFGLMLLCWYIADSLRFGYYLNKQSHLLKILRYNGFVILYPVGVFCELYLIYSTAIAPYLEKHRALPLDLYILSVLLYIPGFPILYSHMWSMRSKALGTKKKQR
jgi:very-long-chain (3R)-3-hydroxyacyl-CoA dehydratase